MYLKLRVIANSKEEKVTRKDPETFLILVRQKAERNMANRRVVEIVARELGIAVGKVRIVSGHQSPSKIVSVDMVAGTKK